MSQDKSTTELRKGRLGVLGIVFFVVAASAPLVGMTGAVPVAMLAGNLAGTPGSYLFVGISLLLFSVGFSAMSSKVTNAGAFFAYVGRGLGRPMAVGSAFASIVGYVTIQLAIYGFFGGLLQGQMSQYGINLDWYLWALIGWVLVTALSLLSVDVGAWVLGGLMILELLSLTVTGVAMMVNGGPEGIDIGASFSPDAIFAGGFVGGAGIALAFAFASFIGFEATAIYGEESKNPKRDVPRATYWAIGIITALFALVSLAMVTGMGHSHVADYVVANSADSTGAPLTNPAGVLFSLADHYVGHWIVDVMSWLIVSSLFAGLLAFQNAAGRYFFALGRGRVLPVSVGTTNKRGAPQIGVLIVSVLALLVILAFKFANLQPIANLFFWMSAITAIAISLVEILVSLAVIRYFLKHPGENVFKVLVAPVLAIISMALGLYLLMSRFALLAGLAPDGVDPSTADSSWKISTLGWVLMLSPFIALVIGIVWSIINKKDDSKLTDDILS
jgi:amino acid transporter